MAVATSTALLVAGVLGAGAIAYQVDEQKKAEKKADRQMAAAEAKQNALIEEAKQKEADLAAGNTAEQKRDQAASEQRSARSRRSGRSSTLLTSPLGSTGNTPGSSSSGGKTLLGQ